MKWRVTNLDQKEEVKGVVRLEEAQTFEGAETPRQEVGDLVQVNPLALHGSRVDRPNTIEMMDLLTDLKISAGFKQQRRWKKQDDALRSAPRECLEYDAHSKQHTEHV
jgi:hypothetical protein